MISARHVATTPERSPLVSSETPSRIRIGAWTSVKYLGPNECPPYHILKEELSRVTRKIDKPRAKNSGSCHSEPARRDKTIRANSAAGKYRKRPRAGLKKEPSSPLGMLATAKLPVSRWPPPSKLPNTVSL